MTKHEYIYNDLYNKIVSGEIKDGMQLPTEKALCDHYSVSRITAMRAVKDLEAFGVVKRITGRGTFVQIQEVEKRQFYYLFVPNLRSKYYGGMATEFSRFFINSQLSSTIVCTFYDTRYTRQVLESLDESHTGGVALIPSGNRAIAAKLLELIEKLKVPVVIGSRALAGFRGHQVVVDEFAAGYMAVEHLFSLGHKRIAYVGPVGNYTSSEIRYSGFLKACESHGLKREFCPVIRNTDSIAIPEIKKLFSSTDFPTALISAGESNAIEILDILASFNIKVPDDVAMVALDGGVLSPSLEKPLTTVDFPGEMIGRNLAVVLREISSGKSWEGTENDKIRTLAPELIVRASCGSHPERYRHEYLRGLIPESFP